MIKTLYLLFLGDASDKPSSNVAQSIRDWRPEFAIGQLRLEVCKANMGLPHITIEEAVGRGVKILVIGVANQDGVTFDVLRPALRQVLDYCAATEARLGLSTVTHSVMVPNALQRHWRACDAH